MGVDLEYISFLQILSSLSSAFQIAVLVLKPVGSGKETTHQTSTSFGFSILTFTYSKSRVGYYNELKMNTIIYAGLKIFGKVYGKPDLVHFHNFKASLLHKSILLLNGLLKKVVFFKFSNPFFNSYFMGGKGFSLPRYALDFKYLSKLEPKIENDFKCILGINDSLISDEDSKFGFTNYENVFSMLNIRTLLNSGKPFLLFMDESCALLRAKVFVTNEEVLLPINLVATYFNIDSLNRSSNNVFGRPEIWPQQNASSIFDSEKLEEFDINKVQLKLQSMYNQCIR